MPEYVASFSIDPPALLAGVMPRKQMNLIVAWAELHQEALLHNWKLAGQQLPPQKIEGLQ
jgi:hypothetical protein